MASEKLASFEVRPVSDYLPIVGELVSFVAQEDGIAVVDEEGIVIGYLSKGATRIVEQLDDEGEYAAVESRNQNIPTIAIYGEKIDIPNLEPGSSIDFDLAVTVIDKAIWSGVPIGGNMNRSEYKGHFACSNGQVPACYIGGRDGAVMVGLLNKNPDALVTINKKSDTTVHVCVISL